MLFRQQLHNLIDARGPRGRAERHRVREVLVVAFRIDEAKRVFVFGEPLEKSGGESRLATARRTHQQDVLSVRRQLHFFAARACVRAEQYVMPAESRLE